MRNQLSEFTLGLPADFEGKDFVSASLKCFAVSSVAFVGEDEVWHCRKVVMPTHIAPSGHYNEEIIRAVRAVLLECVAGGATGAGERIYISRARARKRRILNETEVVEILNQFGFQTIYAEDHSFAEQVKIASRARYLVSNHGAGLTNMLFMPDGASVLELRHDADCVSNCYFTLSSALGLNYFYQTCRANGPDPHFADLTVDTKKLKETLTAFLT
jgi:capsular polysaccharide biosynthesis protein